MCQLDCEGLTYLCVPSITLMLIVKQCAHLRNVQTAFHRNSYQQHLYNHIHLKQSVCKESHWRTSNPAHRRFSVRPNSRQPAHRMDIFLFNDRDGAIQDLFRDDAAKLSSLCSSSTTPSNSKQPITELQRSSSSRTTLLCSRLCFNTVYMSPTTVIYHEWNRPLKSSSLKPAVECN